MRFPGGKRNALAWFSKGSVVGLAVFFGLLAYFAPESAGALAAMFGSACGALGAANYFAGKNETERPSGWIPDGMRPTRPAEFARAMVDELEDGDA